jgi:L-ascorbate oxidase
VAANGVSKSIIVVNRMLPGPAIQVCKGDLVTITVHNNLRHAESTSIHWHGIKQNGTPFMDGVGMLTQCPILPHTSFDYTYK